MQGTRVGAPGPMAIGLILALTLALSFPVSGQTAPEEDPTAGGEPSEEEVISPNRQRNEYGVIGASGLHDGGLKLPPELRVPEQYQYMRPDLQLTEAVLTGNQLPPVLTEMRVLTQEVEPGGEVRAMARVVSPYNKAAPFVSLFYNQELGRAAVMYVNFKPKEGDETLFLGRGKVSKYMAPGRYVVGTTIITDKVGDRKAYWADFHPAMMEEDGEPVGFTVPEHDLVDIDAPVLKSVTIETDRVRAGDGLIRYTVVADDDLSGSTECEAVWVSPSGEKQIRSTMVMVGGRPGTFKGAFSIPKWYEGGEWQLMRIQLTDDATNVRYYFNRTEPLMANATVSVAQEPEMVDSTPAKIVAVQLSKREANVGESVGVTILAEDDFSGVSAIEGYVRSPNGADAVKIKLKNMTEESGMFVDLNRPSKIPEPNVWTGSFKVTETMEWGRWELVRLGIADNANNFRLYYEDRDEEIDGVYVDYVNDEAEEKATEEQK